MSISESEFMLKQILMFAVLMRFFPSRQMLLMSILSAKSWQRRTMPGGLDPLSTMNVMSKLHMNTASSHDMEFSKMIWKSISTQWLALLFLAMMISANAVLADSRVRK